MMIKFTPDEWCKLTGVDILDPDGWDRKGSYDWNLPISFRDFYDKTLMSTTSNLLQNRDAMIRDLGF